MSKRFLNSLLVLCFSSGSAAWASCDSELDACLLRGTSERQKAHCYASASERAEAELGRRLDRIRENFRSAVFELEFETQGDAENRKARKLIERTEEALIDIERAQRKWKRFLKAELRAVRTGLEEPDGPVRAVEEWRLHLVRQRSYDLWVQHEKQVYEALLELGIGHVGEAEPCR